MMEYWSQFKCCILVHKHYDLLLSCICCFLEIISSTSLLNVPTPLSVLWSFKSSLKVLPILSILTWGLFAHRKCIFKHSNDPLWASWWPVSTSQFYWLRLNLHVINRLWCTFMYMLDCKATTLYHNDWIMFGLLWFSFLTWISLSFLDTFFPCSMQSNWNWSW